MSAKTMTEVAGIGLTEGNVQKLKNKKQVKWAEDLFEVKQLNIDDEIESLSNEEDSTQTLGVISDSIKDLLKIQDKLKHGKLMRNQTLISNYFSSRKASSVLLDMNEGANKHDTVIEDSVLKVCNVPDPSLTCILKGATPDFEATTTVEMSAANDGAFIENNAATTPEPTVMGQCQNSFTMTDSLINSSSKILPTANSTSSSSLDNIKQGVIECFEQSSSQLHFAKFDKLDFDILDVNCMQVTKELDVSDLWASEPSPISKYDQSPNPAQSSSTSSLAKAPLKKKPWLLLGDFNCIRFSYEKLGGSFYPPFLRSYLRMGSGINSLRAEAYMTRVICFSFSIIQHQFIYFAGGSFLKDRKDNNQRKEGKFHKQPYSFCILQSGISYLTLHKTDLQVSLLQKLVLADMRWVTSVVEDGYAFYRRQEACVDLLEMLWKTGSLILMKILLISEVWTRLISFRGNPLYVQKESCSCWLSVLATLEDIVHTVSFKPELTVYVCTFSY